MSPSVAWRLDPAAVLVTPAPAAQLLYAAALRSFPVPMPQPKPSNSEPHAPATPYLHTPAGRHDKFDKAANKYWYIKRVEMEWFGNNPDLDGSNSNGEEDDWSTGEWGGGVQAGLDVSKATSLDRGP
jgi:hypothetical protein